MHLRLLKASSIALRKELAGLERRMSTAAAHVGQLRDRRIRELEVAASTLIARRELTRIPGIGAALKERILAQCFDGTLDSLYRAGNVRGVGPQRAAAVRHWVGQQKNRLPTFIQNGFPGKEEIMRAHDKLEREADSQLSSLKSKHEEKKRLQAKIDEELKWLSSVGSFAFLRALEGQPDAARQVSRYLVGVFPEWERIPEWFKDAMKVSGTEQKSV